MRPFLAFLILIVSVVSVDYKVLARDVANFAVMPITPRGIIIQSSPIPVDITAAMLGIGAGDLPVLLRFGVDPTFRTGWSISIRNSAGAIDITPEAWREFGASTSSFQLALNGLDTIRVIFSGAAPALIYKASIKITQGERPRYIFSNGDFHLYYAVKELIGQPIRLAISRAIVKLEFDVLEGPTQCTGFQIGPGEFLTNRHCADPNLRPDRSTATKVIFGVDDRHPGGQGFTVANLSKMGKSPDNGDLGGGLDYALLTAKTIPTAYKDAIIDLNHRAAVRSDEPLELYQVWAGQVGSGAGIAVSMNQECVAGRVSATAGRPLTDPSCLPPDFLHGCDSDGGSSGSPVFVRGTNTLVGIHWGQASATVGNCAVSIEDVVKDLQQ